MVAQNKFATTSSMFSIVIPAYNEGKSLPVSLPVVRDYLSTHFPVFEIVLVDDGSTDDTVGIANEFAKSHPEVRVLRLPQNRGKGAAVRAGMLAARGDVIVFTDADLSTPMEEIDKALGFLNEGADLVIGSRSLPASEIQRHQPVSREVMGRTFNLLVRGMFGLPFRDTQCGFKCYRRKAAQAIYSQTRIDGFAFDVETLVIARHLGCQVVEMPVHWLDSPQSTVRIPRHVLMMMWELFRIALREAVGA